MEKGKKSPDTQEHLTVEGFPPAEGRPGPGWRAWMVSIVVAIALSVTATLLLGSGSAFRPESATAASVDGCGRGCCGDQGK